MQSQHFCTYMNEDFTTCTGHGAADQKRFGLITGLLALGFLFFGGAEILILLFGHGHSASGVPFHLPSVVIAGVSFGLCILTVKLKPAL
jgi:hypothetical protein